MAISTNGTVLARLAGGLYNQTLSNTTYNEVVAVAKSTTDINNLANDLYSRDFASKTDLSVATTLVANLGLSSVAGLNNWVAAQLTAAGAAGKGAKIVSLLNDFSNLTTDAIYGSYASAFNAKTEAALALSQTDNSKGGDFNAAATLAAAQAAAAAAAQAAADAAAKATSDAAAKAAADAAAAKIAADAAAAKVAADAAAAAAAPKITALTTGVDTAATSTANDTVTGVISTTSTSTTFNATDVVIDTTSTDTDTFTLTIEADVTAANTGLVRGFETVNVNANATTLTDTNLDFAATNFAGVKTFNFDVVKPVTAVGGLVMTALDINNATVNTSDDFTVASVAGATGKNLNINASSVGTSGSPTGVTVTGAMGDVTVTGVGHLSVTSNASTGLLSATAAKNLTVSGTAAQIISATATGGNVTISDATASLSTTVTATGDVTVAKLDAAGKLNVTAGGTITLTGTTSGGSDLDITSATLSSVGASSIADADAITNLTLSGNGGKATYTMTAGSAALADVNVTGASDVVLKLSAASVETTSAVLNVNDTGSGVFNLELGTSAGTVDLRGGSIDKLTVTVDNDSKVLSVKSGQVVTYKVAQADTAGGTATTLAVGVDANATSNTVTIKLDDEVKDGNAVAITALTITQAKTVTIDASADATAGGGGVTHNITTLIASGAKSNVTINAGANNIEFANGGATTVSTTGSIVLTGSGTLTDAATVTSLTAGTLDASAMTGKVTLNSTTDLAVNTIRTGSKDDAVTLTSTTLDQTVSMGAGDDTLTLQALGGSVIVAIDLGDGTNDRLKFAAQDTKLIGTTVSLAGVEIIEFADVTGQQVKASLLSGATYKIDATAANTKTVAVIVDAADKAVDLSKLVGSTAVETAVAGMTFTTDANANTAAITITGSTSAKNNITGSGVSGDVLVGGTKADIFNYSSSSLLFGSSVMLDTIDGGTGTSSATSTTQLVDAINFTATAANVTVAATDSFAKATSIEAITTGSANTGVISLTLGTTAETAGIRTVTIGDADGTGGHTVNVSAFTAAVTINGNTGVEAITGGAGNDVITGGGGADSLTGGNGDDTFVFSTLAALIATNAIVPATISGGDGNDVISVGPATGGLTIANNDIFTKITGVETLTARANTGAVSISTDVTAYGLGFRTINISAGTAASSNVIDVSETVTATHAWTLVGSATGSTAITGGTGNDTVSGGSAADTFNTSPGNDAVSLSAGGTDTVVFNASLTTNGIDTITGFQVGPTTLTGYDVLTLKVRDAAGTTIANLAGTDLVSVSAIASNALTITVEKINEVNLITTQTLRNATDGSELLLLLKEANGGTTATIAAGTAAAGRDGHIIAYADGNAYVYYFLDAATDGVVASEIALIGIISGVAPGGIEAGNLG